MESSRKTVLILLATVGAVIFSAAGHAEGSSQIYKWVDKNGETHFTQLPPKQGEAQVVKPDFATPAATDETEHAPAATNEETNSKPLKPDQPVLAINKKEAAKACEAAKAQIKMLQDSQNQLMTQDADGKYRPLSAEEIAGRLKQAQDVANKACVQ